MLKEMNIRFPVVTKELVRSAAVGVTGLMMNVAFMMLFVEVFQVYEEIAAIYSTILVLVGGFIATNWWVFTEVDNRHNTDRLLKRGSSYYGIMLTSKLINYGIYLGLISIKVWYPLSWLIGSISVFIFTFSLNRLVWYNIK
jgi:putative flippase GtrA